MTTAGEIAAALRHNLPDLTPGRIHRLLYLTQGHHLAWFNEPLFDAAVVAWDTGVTIPAIRGKELDGPAGYGNLPEKILNTVGYVCSRYGGLHLHDLDLLTRNGTPAVEADRGRRPGTSRPIDRDAMTAYFQTVDVDPDAPIIDAQALADLVKGAEGRRREPSRPDDMGRIQARIDELRDRTTVQSG